jgi:DNA-binding NarL/FixJ family response regulator
VSSGDAIRVILADDHAVVRAGLARLLEEQPDIRVVGEAADGDATLRLAREVPADVLLLDVRMPGPGFLETLRHVRARAPALRVLVLSVQPEDHFAVRALRAGAAGYLSKERSSEELVQAVRRVHGGQRYLTSAVAERLADRLGTDGVRPPHEDLSDREHEIFVRIAMGQAVSDIAADLSLSPKTVSTYRARVLSKLGLKTNADLARYAVEHDLLG